MDKTESSYNVCTNYCRNIRTRVINEIINPLEAIKRLAAAQGIDVLNLVKTQEELQASKEEQMQEMQNKLYYNKLGNLLIHLLILVNNLNQPPQPE